MKRKLLGSAAIICIMLIYGSCYKTGEVIYQPTCKLDSLVLSNEVYEIFHQVNNGFTPYLNMKFTYNNNFRLTSATSYVSGSPFYRFDFVYDGSNNLTEIDIWDLNQPLLQKPRFYFSLQYPAGTKNSISNTLTELIFSLIGNDYIGEDPWVYNFNTEYQLQSRYQGQRLKELLSYDYGGNLLADSLYGMGNQVISYYAYSSYDNLINPCRADRALQIFLGLYSKNNAGSGSVYYLFGDQFQLHSSLTGNYTYNIHGYPTHYMDAFFADYTCLMAPPIVPGPLGGGNPVGK